MDRIQKQLVKTYFRKRNIAIEQSDDMDFYTKYRIYELIYGVENNFIDIGELKKILMVVMFIQFYRKNHNLQNI